MTTWKETENSQYLPYFESLKLVLKKTDESSWSQAKGWVTLPNWMYFMKSSKGGGGGGGVIFNPKIHIADFGNFKQGFLSMKFVQTKNFMVQGMFFSTIVLRKNQNKTHFEDATSDSSPFDWNFSENPFWRRPHP